MEQNIYQRSALIYGLIGGLIFVLLHFGAWAFGVPTYISVSGLEKVVPYVILLLIFAGLQLRKKNGGFLPYSEALKFAFLAFIIVVIIEAVSNYILFNVVDKNLTASLLVFTKEQTVQLLKKMGSTQNQIDEAVKNITSDKETNFKTIFLGTGISIIWSFGKAALIALVIRKEKIETE